MKTIISIIIIVKNDRGIADTLTSLEIQKTATSEIIVVDSSDPSFLADIRQQHPDVRWYQFVPAIPSKTSIPEQRNFGIRRAKGELIVFIDANCVPSEHWLKKLTQNLLDKTETITAGPVRALRPSDQINFNPVGLKGNYLSASPTINLAFMKSVWEEVAGFDESFLFGSDIDFTWRCVNRGHKIRFIPEAFITHDWGDFKYEIKRSFRYGKARVNLFMKHPDRRRELLGESIIIPTYSLYLIGLPITIILPWYPLIIIIPIIKNIRNHPIKTTFLNSIYAIGFLKELLVTYV